MGTVIIIGGTFLVAAALVLIITRFDPEARR
jgi:hypothetical protein